MSNPALHFDKVRETTVEIAVLYGHKGLNMTFHDLSRTLGYDRTGEKILVPWQECQKIYNRVTDITTPAKDGAKPGPHPSLAAYEAWTEKMKTFWGKLLQEGLRRAKYSEIMVELRDAKMSKSTKNLKRAELKEEERSARRKQWSDMVPGKCL